MMSGRQLNLVPVALANGSAICSGAGLVADLVDSIISSSSASLMLAFKLVNVFILYSGVIQ